jgi:hypothetical protein
MSSQNRFRSLPVTPQPGTTANRILDVVEAQALAATNVIGSSAGAIGVDLFNAYLRWVNEAARQLGAVVRDRDVEALVLSQRQWVLQRMDPTTNGDLPNLLRLELEERITTLNEMAASLRDFVGRWNPSDAGHLVIPDTNVYLHGEEDIATFDWRKMADIRPHDRITVIIPILVVDELDRSKRDDVRTQARLTLKKLNEMFSDPAYSVPLTDKDTRARLLLDAPNHERLADADSEFIDRVHALAVLSGLPTVVLTYDMGMSLRAKASGISVKWEPRPEQAARSNQSGRRGSRAFDRLSQAPADSSPPAI